MTGFAQDARNVAKYLVESLFTYPEVVGPTTIVCGLAMALGATLRNMPEDVREDAYQVVNDLLTHYRDHKPTGDT